MIDKTKPFLRVSYHHGDRALIETPLGATARDGGFFQDFTEKDLGGAERTLGIWYFKAGCNYDKKGGNVPLVQIVKLQEVDGKIKLV